MTAPEPFAEETDWARALREVLVAGGPQLAFQPVMDLQRDTVAGYECLSRFPGDAPPDIWFAEAGRVGLQPRWRRTCCAGL